MGKTSKPLNILALGGIAKWDEVKTLKEQGHEIDDGKWSEDGIDLTEYDIILGPRCWRMDEDHREYLDLAISEARKVRYPKEGKNDPTD